MHPISGSNRKARPAHSLRIRIAIATLCLPVHACDLGSGGAVELSWSLRPASSAMTAKFVGCEGRDSSGSLIWAITQIQLHWQVGSVTGSKAWSCDANHGATGFEIAPGPANLWVTPACGPAQTTPPSDDDVPAAPDTYIAPAIVQRDVIRGETVTLGAVELVVSVATCPQPPLCVCPPTGAQLATDHTER
jgi:hypothetical protein